MFEVLTSCGLGSDVPTQDDGKSTHFLFTQHCFFFPGPPYLGLSRHILHTLHSSAVQPVQIPHRPLFFPEEKWRLLYV